MSDNNNTFYNRIWSNLQIRNYIIKQLRNYHNNNLISKLFNEISEFNEDLNKNEIESVKLMNCFGNISDFIQFLNSLPNNIKILKIQNEFHCTPNIRDLKFPSTLEELMISSLYPLNTNSNQTYKEEIETFEEISNYSYRFKNLKNLSLFNGFKISKLYPIFPTMKSLTSLDIGSNAIDIGPNVLPLNLIYFKGGFKSEIVKDVLPSKLLYLTLTCSYIHQSIVFPIQLKSFRINVCDGYYVSILNGLPPTVAELLLFNGFKKKDFETILFKLPPNLIKFAITDCKCLKVLEPPNIFIKLFNSKDAYQFPKSLTNLDLSCIVSQNENRNDKIDLNLLPNHLKKIKIHQYILLHNIDNSSYPESLTSLEGDLFNHIFYANFKSPSNIKKLKLNVCYGFEIDEIPAFHFDKFKNLNSLKFNLGPQDYIIYEISKILKFTRNITNLEFYNPHTRKVSNSEHLDLKLNITCPNLKSLKLSYIQTIGIFTNYLSDSSKQSQLSLCENILLLDLNLDGSNESIIIDPIHLPPNLKILIIRGTTTPKISLPLPRNIQTIYISYYNSTILKDKEFMNKCSQYIKTFDQISDECTNNQYDSKIYRILKKYINKFY